MRRSSQLKLMHIYCVYLHSSSGRYLSTQFNLIVIFKRRDGYRTIRYGRNGKPSHCVPSIVYCAKRRPTLIADFVAVSHAFQGYHFFFFGRFVLFGGFLVLGFWFCLTVLFYANCCWHQRILPTGLHDSFAILTRKGAENYHALRLPAPFFIRL